MVQSIGKRLVGGFIWLLWSAAVLLPMAASAQVTPVVLTTATNALDLTVGVPFSRTYVGTGTVANLYNLVGTLPPGLTFAANATTATISGTPTTPGSYSFIVRVRYTGLATGVYDSPFAVTVNAPPTANPVTATVQANSSTNAIAPSLGGGPTTSLAIAGGPAHGTASVSGIGLVYTPATNYVGPDSFTYTASGPAGTSAPATVSISVVVAPPTAAAAMLSVPYGTPGTIDLAPFVSGPTFTGVTVAVGTPPANGTATAQGSRITYTPNPGFIGNDSLTYIATAVGGDSRPAVLTIVVGTRPDPSRQGNVIGTLEAGAAAVRHYQTTQIENVHSRLSQLQGDTIDGVGPSVRECGRYSLWAAGIGGHGDRGGAGSNAFRFDTAAMTVGADRCFGEGISMGIGIGYGRDHSGQKGDASAAESSATSAAAYGAIRLLPRLRVDWMAGVGRAQFQYDRYVSERDESAHGRWAGTQWMSSASASYNLKFRELRLTPYSRVDAATLQVDGYSESGGGPFALRYQSQRLTTGRVAFGFNSEYRYESDFGRAVPKLRVEYQRDFAQRQQVGVSYADTPGGPTYLVAADNQERRLLAITVGGDLYMRNGLTVGFQHTFGRANGNNDSNMTQLRAVQKF